MIPLEEARSRVLDAMPKMDSETAAVADALGMVTAVPVIAGMRCLRSRTRPWTATPCSVPTSTKPR
jgi:hypothetical protein